MERIIRHGAYGVVLSNFEILLTEKKSGPYKGLWGLPGGAVEFGETPEVALKRELLEESTLETSQLEFLSIATATGTYDIKGESLEFHQVGIIYKVLDWKKRSDLVAEEANRWYPLNNIKKDELTPFAKHAVATLPLSGIWRPLNKIRGKVIGLAKHEGCLLVFEVLDDDGILKGWCPIGGGIEFGETAEKALMREIFEELNCSAKITGKALTCENIYEHHGSIGHEIIFAFPIKFQNEEIYKKKRFQIYESGGSSHWVEWIQIESFLNKEKVLYPSILLDTIVDI